MPGAEAFTVLAILEARDKASEIFAKIDESLGKFSESAGGAADAARAAGDTIDDSLLKTASGADALDVATARVEAAQAKQAQTASALADAERELIAAREQDAESADGDAASTDRLTAAGAGYTAAQRDMAAATKLTADAQKAQSDVAAASAAKNDEAAASTAAVSDASKEGGLSLASMGKAAGITALGLGIAGAVMVKAAGNFQDSTVHLQTDAGVTAQNLGMVRAGILQVSTATGQSAEDITNAMYHIASSGFTAQNGLNILKIAAEGARVGGADLDTTTKTLVGTMTAYYGSNLSAGAAMKDSTSLMNQMIETVSRGDMRMQDLASSLSAVTPVAAAAHISFAQVGGAIATMTAQGMSARQATQDLAHTIRSLASPTNVQAVEMKALGLNANTVAKNLGTTGLAGTLNQMRNAVLSNTSGGYVMLNLLKGMTPATQGLANQILAGTITTNGLTQAVKGLNPEQAALISRFKTSATSVTGLKQTFTGAMYKMLGGATGLNVALMLTGKHMGDLTTSTAKIAAAGKKASGTVDNWSTIQGTFNFKVAQAKTAVENTGIAIGSALLPAVSAIVSAVGKVLVPVAEWTAKHQKLTEILFVGVTALAATIAAVSLATKTFKAVKGAIDSVSSAVKGTIAAYQKLTGKSKQAADAQKKDATDTAATQEAKAEESAGVQEQQSAEAAAAQEADAGEVAAANETAATESSAGWIAGAAKTVASWAGAGVKMIAGAAKWVAEGALKVAAYVAENVFGAEATETAWTLANAAMLLGIGLVIAAVVVAVVEIVKHWSQITAAVSKVWHDVFEGTKEIISDVISFIKSHWALIVGIFLGPIALVVALVVQHWKLIEHYFQDGVQAVEKALSWFTGLAGRFRQWVGGAASAVASEGGKILRWFTELPGKVVSEVEKIATDLFTSGEHIIESLANGISSAASGALHSAMSFVGNTIKSFLPFSPAKQGPLSGAGDPGNSGRSIAGNLARGITAATPQAAAAALKMAATVHAATSGLSATGGSTGIGSSLALSATSAAGGGGGNAYITVDVHGNTIMNDSDVNRLVAKVGAGLVKSLAQAGYKSRLT